jgi:hypothetical protein
LRNGLCSFSVGLVGVSLVCGCLARPAHAVGGLSSVTLPSGQSHIPTEEELDRRLGRRHGEDDSERGYQRDSVESFGQRSHEAATWVQRQLSGIHVTPARFLLGLGLLGVLITWNKNKRKVQWAVLTGFAYLLVILGAAAIFFRWPYMN